MKIEDANNAKRQKHKIQEADYRSLSKIQNDNFNYELKIDMANQIIDDIADNIYTISNKLESIQKIARSLDLDIDNDVENIIVSMYHIFDVGDSWYTICQQFEKLS